MVKKYKSSTGVDEFYYAVIATETDTTFTTSPIERVKFLQNIEVELPQEIIRAYGDNKTAELATSNGNVSVSGAFHVLPTEDKAVLFGLEVVDGMTSYGADDEPPYVACMFMKTYEDGSKQWVGLTKGMFMRSKIAGKTAEENTEFQSDEITGEFMERVATSFATPKTVLFGEDAKGITVNRDALFMEIFGKAYPVAVPEGA